MLGNSSQGKSTKVVTIVLILITLSLGGLAVFAAISLNQDSNVNPTDSSASTDVGTNPTGETSDPTDVQSCTEDYGKLCNTSNTEEVGVKKTRDFTKYTGGNKVEVCTEYENTSTSPKEFKIVQLWTCPSKACGDDTVNGWDGQPKTVCLENKQELSPVTIAPGEKEVICGEVDSSFSGTIQWDFYGTDIAKPIGAATHTPGEKAANWCVDQGSAETPQCFAYIHEIAPNLCKTDVTPTQAPQITPAVAPTRDPNMCVEDYQILCNESNTEPVGVEKIDDYTNYNEGDSTVEVCTVYKNTSTSEKEFNIIQLWNCPGKKCGDDTVDGWDGQPKTVCVENKQEIDPVTIQPGEYKEICGTVPSDFCGTIQWDFYGTDIAKPIGATTHTPGEKAANWCVEQGSAQTPQCFAYIHEVCPDKCPTPTPTIPDTTPIPTDPPYTPTQAPDLPDTGIGNLSSLFVLVGSILLVASYTIYKSGSWRYNNPKLKEE